MRWGDGRGSFGPSVRGLPGFSRLLCAGFGRKQWRERSGQYLQALLVQSQERRNAENLSETVTASPRVLQRFLTEARWDDDAVIGRLQEYLCSRLEHPQAVWVLDGSDFPKQGVKSAGVARQYCGALGKIANCQAGVFLAHVGPRGRALVDKRLYLPEEWTGDGERCATAGVPANRREYQSKTELALDMLECAQARDYFLPPQRTVGGWRFRFRDVADAAGGPGVCGNVLRFGRASGYDGVAAGTDLDRSALPGQRASPQTQTAA